EASRRLAVCRLGTMRAGRQDRRAVRDDGPSATRAGKRAGAGDVAGTECKRRIVAMQQVALDVLAQALAVLRGELAGGDERGARGLQRLVHRRERGLAGLRQQLLERILQAVEELLLPVALGARDLPDPPQRRIAQGARSRPGALASQVRADGAPGSG